MRFAARSKRIHDPDIDCYFGPSPAAFALRDGDKGGISVTWVEFFGSFNKQSRALAATAFRDTLRDKKLPPNAIFAWARISDIKRAGNQYRKGVRVVHDPVEGNQGHAEIRHFTPEDLDILDYLSSSVFIEYCEVKNMELN
ncbi:MAG: hypothetical protein ACK4ZW_17380 [Blastomonas sp.]